MHQSLITTAPRIGQGTYPGFELFALRRGGGGGEARVYSHGGYSEIIWILNIYLGQEIFGNIFWESLENLTTFMSFVSTKQA